MDTPRVNPSERHRELLAQLSEQIGALRTTGGWHRWIAVATHFTEYSLKNQILILMQRPDATRIAGYKAWQELGRQVNKGERGIDILAPLTRVIDEDADDGHKNIVTGFRVVRVFDVTQTSGAPLPELALPDIAGSSETVFAALVATAHGEELEVRHLKQPNDWPGPRGWINRGEHAITLVDYGQGLDNLTRTLLHELAHYCDPATDHPNTKPLMPVLEVVAETAAMIVGTGVLGLQMSEASTTYVATWIEALADLDADWMAELAEHALRVARHLEAIVTPHLRAATADQDDSIPILEGIG